MLSTLRSASRRFSALTRGRRAPFSKFRRPVNGGNASRNTHGAKKTLLAATMIGGGSILAAGSFLHKKKSKKSEKISTKLPNTDLNTPSHSMPEARPDLPYFTADEVRKHCTEEEGYWVTFKGAVYDISTFTGGHPGGKPRLLMAAGGDLAAFWEVYPEQHLRGHVVPWLDSKLRIGNMTASEHSKLEKEASFESYYENDPERDPDLLANTHHPFNGEPRHHLLVENYFTPNELFYVRLHLNVPDIDPEEYTLTVQGEGVRTTVFTLEDLKTKFKKHTVVNTMQCAGNRREDFHGPNGRKIFIGPHWISSAFSCASWSGPLMRDVLEYCGLDVDGIALDKVKTDVKHVQFESYDETETGLAYGSGVEIMKVADPFGKVLCAYEMNGEDLPRDHGYPVRALVPGRAGARSAKFLKSITCSETESQKPWQIHAYRLFAPNITFEDDLYLWYNSPKVDLDKAQIVQELPVQSMACWPPVKSTIGVGADGKVLVKGVAHGWGKGIARVDTSIDNGVTFQAADLYKPQWVRDKECRGKSEYAWEQFTAEFELNDEQKAQLARGKDVEIWVTSKAVDRAANVQPSDPTPYYNARGVAINHMYRYPVTVSSKLQPGEVVFSKTGDGCYEGFQNVPTGGSMVIPWKVGPYSEEDWHKCMSTTNYEEK